MAVHALFTSFDLLSPKSRSFQCKVKRDKFDFDPIPVLSEGKEEVAKATKSDEDLDLLPPELRELVDNNESSVGENREEAKTAEAKEAAEKKAEEEEDAAKKAAEEATAAEKQKNSTGDELDALKELADKFVIDLRAMAPIGPIIHFGLYQIPPQSKKIKQWLLTQGEDFYQFEVQIEHCIKSLRFI